MPRSRKISFRSDPRLDAKLNEEALPAPDRAALSKEWEAVPSQLTDAELDEVIEYAKALIYVRRLPEDMKPWVME